MVENYGNKLSDLIASKEISKTTAEDKYRYFSLFFLHNKK